MDRVVPSTQKNLEGLGVPLIALRRYNYGDDVNLSTIQKFKVALNPLLRN